MGTSSLDHISVTPRLHVGTWAPFFHVATDDPLEAACALEGGLDAVVPNGDVAAQTLMVNGMAEQAAIDHVSFALGRQETP